MKLRAIAFLGILMLVAAGSKPVCAQVEVSVRTNFSDLDQYGEWIHVHGYGTVWRPYAEAGWRPFTYGHWVYTRDGWMWDSDEPFGWIVCHYGNWYNDEELGWLWVPGYEWSPARVEWNVTDRDIAWAPLAPPPLAGRHYHRLMHVEWTTCPAPFFTAPDLRTHVEVRAGPVVAENRVRVYGAPPRLDFVRRVVRAPVVTVVPNRVSVARGERPLVRVEVQSQSRPQVVVPVGPRFRRATVRGSEQQSSEVRTAPQQDSRQRVVPAENDNSPQTVGDRPSAKVRVEQNSGRDDDQNVKVRSKKDDEIRVNVEPQ